MADVIRHRPESRSPHDSLDSHDDSSSTVSGEVQLTMEQIREECQRLRRENSQFTMRLLGVNELARLLQEKTEACESLQDKCKRLEIAVVRLENRCSNFEKKLRSQTSTSLPSGVGTASGNANPKSTQSPFIPGPSRQILDSLLKENSELKKTITAMAKRGPTGYIEAVKMTQLEEELDQKNSEIEHLKKQLDTLTAPQGDEDAQAWMNDPKLLQRQLMKMQQSMRIKDRFCSLLSDRIGQLQKEVNESKKVEGVDGQEDSGYPQSMQSEQMSADSGSIDPSQIKDLHQREKKLSKMLAEAQKKLEIERKERTSIVSQAQEHVTEINSLKKELDEYQKKLENLSSFNETLLEDKSKLKADLEGVKQRVAEADSMKSDQLRLNQAMNALKLRHSRDLDDKNQEIKRLNVLLEDAQFKFAMAESRINSMGQGTPSQDQKLEKLEEEIQGLQSHNQQLQHMYQESRLKCQQLYSHCQALAARVPQTPAGLMRTGGLNVQTSRAHEGSTMFKGMEGLVDGKSHPDTKTNNKPLYGSVQNALDTVIRQEILSRGDDPKLPDDSRTSQSHNKPVTLPISGNPQRSLTNAQTQPQTPLATPTAITYHKPVTDVQAHAQSQAHTQAQAGYRPSSLTNTGYGGTRAHSPSIPSHAHVPGSVPISTAESAMIGGGAVYPPASQSPYSGAQYAGYQQGGHMYTSSSQAGGSLPSYYRQQLPPPSQRYMELQFSGHPMPPPGHPSAMTPGHPSGMPPSGGGNAQTLPSRRHSPPNYSEPRYHQQGGPHSGPHQGGPHSGPHQGGPH